LEWEESEYDIQERKGSAKDERAFGRRASEICYDLIEVR